MSWPSYICFVVAAELKHLLRCDKEKHRSLMQELTEEAVILSADVPGLFDARRAFVFEGRGAHSQCLKLC